MGIVLVLERRQGADPFETSNCYVINCKITMWAMLAKKKLTRFTATGDRVTRHWHLTVSDTQVNSTASTVQNRRCGATDGGSQSVIKTRRARVCLQTRCDCGSPWPCCPAPTCSRRTCSPWCDSKGTPLRGNKQQSRRQCRPITFK